MLWLPVALRLNVLTAIGGIDVHGQLRSMRDGVHALVGTTGRTMDLLRRKSINLDICR